jgi:predicted nucleic acid-binding protein
MYLLDTNVISELRRPRPHGAVLAWFGSVREADLYIAAVTIGEIQAGIERTREQNAEKAAEFDVWLGKVLQTFAVLPMDAEMFRLWAKLVHRKSDELYEDAMIAATALRNDFAVVTRNVRDFAFPGVKTLNPFEHPK